MSEFKVGDRVEAARRIEAACFDVSKGARGTVVSTGRLFALVRWDGVMAAHQRSAWVELKELRKVETTPPCPHIKDGKCALLTEGPELDRLRAERLMQHKREAERVMFPEVPLDFDSTEAPSYEELRLALARAEGEIVRLRGRLECIAVIASD